MSECRSCGAPVVWAVNKDGKAVPMNPPRKAWVKVGELDSGTPVVEVQAVWESHFATCPQASEWRRDR